MILDLTGTEFCVYVLWGDDPTALYVGASTNVLMRIGDHLSNPRKRESVRRVEIISCVTSAAMWVKETEMIRSMLPLWNIKGTPDQEERARRIEWAKTPKPRRLGDRQSVKVCDNCRLPISGHGNDRPRKRRCRACYWYLERHRADRAVDQLVNSEGSV